MSIQYLVVSLLLAVVVVLVKIVKSEGFYFWIVFASALLLSLLAPVISYNDAQHRSHDAEIAHRREVAIQDAEKARRTFYEGLDSQSLPRIRTAQIVLEKARKEVSEYKDLEYYQISTLHDSALAAERLAYRDTVNATLYWTSGSRACKRAISRGSVISPSPRLPKNTQIHCTDIADVEMWKRARTEYGELRHEIEMATETNGGHVDDSAFIEEVVAAGRSAGYFFLCDYLRNNERTLDSARGMWNTVERLSSDARAVDLRERHEEILLKLQFLDVLSASPSASLDCVLPSLTHDATIQILISAWKVHWTPGRSDISELLADMASRNYFLSGEDATTVLDQYLGAGQGGKK